MAERQGHWIIGKSKEDLYKKREELNEYLYDVILEEGTIEKFYKTIYRFNKPIISGCVADIRKKLFRAYVHYIV
jgi:hypothetical protein